MHYLDNAATTAVAPAVRETIQQMLNACWGNPSSLYRLGMEAEERTQQARATVAEAMGCTEKEVFFTGSGTEANNIAILGAARARKNWGAHIVATGYEHPSVSQSLAALAKQEGFSVTEIPPGRDGRVDPDQLIEAVGSKTVLVCAMHVNNENGAVLDVAKLATSIKQKNARTFVHVDGVQGFLKRPVILSRTKIDGYAVSGHKIHAPKGIGALYLKQGFHIEPPFHGGGQEKGVRPGTENTAYIAGFAKGVKLAQEHYRENQEKIIFLHEKLMAGLARMPEIILHSPKDGYPGIVFFSMPAGLKSQVMLNHLDQKYGVCVSSGSACSGGTGSHTLTAMGVPKKQIDSALRVSFCGNNTEEDVEVLLEGLKDCCTSLIKQES